MTIYHFTWESFEWDHVISENLNSNKHFLNESDCYGLYYITGSHFLYGQNTLLYLGKSQDQRFGYRLSQHSDFDFTNVPRINKLYIGKLLNRDDGNSKSWGEAINLSEKLFINSLLPAMNSQNIKGILDNEIYGEIVICNWNDIGFLLPEISGYRFSGKYWDEQKYPENPLTE